MNKSEFVRMKFAFSKLNIKITSNSNIVNLQTRKYGIVLNTLFFLFHTQKTMHLKYFYRLAHCPLKIY